MNSKEWDSCVSEVKEGGSGKGGKKFLHKLIKALKKLEIPHNCVEEDAEEEK